MVTIRYMVGAATIIPISVSLSLMSLSPFPLPSLPSLSGCLLISEQCLLLSGLVPVGRNPICHYSEQVPARESFISHFLLWESGSVETQLEAAHWAQIA